jgi:hypothetical protein
VLVEPGVDTNVVCSHLLLSKLLQLLHGSGSSVLEADSVEPLVEVDCVLAGDDFTHGGALALLLAFGRHLEAKLQEKLLNKTLSFLNFKT